MPESSRVEIVFAYTRDEMGVYHGTAETKLGGGVSERPSLSVVLTRPEWVRFVIDTIQKTENLGAVAFRLARRDNAPHLHYLDSRTVAKIKACALSADDLIL